jgi:hypothetical protein
VILQSKFNPALPDAPGTYDCEWQGYPSILRDDRVAGGGPNGGYMVQPHHLVLERDYIMQKNVYRVR